MQMTLSDGEYPQLGGFLISAIYAICEKYMPTKIIALQ